MVATIRSWVFDPNFSVAGGSFDLQARSSWFRFHQLVNGTNGVDLNGVASVAGAWAVESSGNGAGTFGAGNNILAEANIIFAAGGAPHSWAVYTSPAALIPTRTLRLCVDWNDPATPFSTATVAIFPGVPTVAGTNTARPTHTNEVVLPNVTWFSNTAFTARRTHGWRTSIGELLFLFSRTGVGFPENALWLPRFDNGEAATVWPFNLFGTSNAGARGALDSGQLQSAGNWSGFWQSDVPHTGNKNMQSLLGSVAGTWPLGRSNISNAIGDAPLTMTWDSATQAGFPGVVVDVRSAPGNVPENETQDGDTDLVRRLTVGEIWVPNRAAAGALIL